MILDHTYSKAMWNSLSGVKESYQVIQLLNIISNWLLVENVEDTTMNRNQANFGEFQSS